MCIRDSGRGAYTNKSTGVSITLRCGLRERHIVRHWLPSASLAGRGLGVRVKRSGLDVAVVGCYFPPRPRGLQGRPNYFHT
eukprot:2944194-Pyramimonas_sp.AAC.1